MPTAVRPDQAKPGRQVSHTDGRKPNALAAICHFPGELAGNWKGNTKELGLIGFQFVVRASQAAA